MYVGPNLFLALDYNVATGAYLIPFSFGPVRLAFV